MRLRGLIRKEFLQIVRDPSSIAIAFLMPIFLLLLFGYGVSLDSEHMPVALVVEQPGADTADFTAAFHQSRYFEPHAVSGHARCRAGDDGRPRQCDRGVAPGFRAASCASRTARRSS